MANQQILDALENSIEDLGTIAPVAKLMLYGNSGAGKTVLGITIAQKITRQDKDIIYVDFKEGWVSLLNHDPKLRSRVRRIVYKGFSQLEAIVDAIEIKHGSFANVGAIVLDEHTSMFQDDMELLTRTRAKSDKEKDPDTPTWPDMNTSGIRTRRNLNKLLSLKVHVILLCHERDDKDKKGVVVTGPAYLPKLSPRIREPLHFAGRCVADIAEGGQGGRYRRSVQCHPSRTIVAKSRIGGLEVFESHGKLVEKIAGWLNRGGVPDKEAEQVILADEQDAHDPDIVEPIIDEE